MQVFETISYNLKQLRFKDTKAYLDSLLGQLDVTYDNMGFCFDVSLENYAPILKKYPFLEKYLKNRPRERNEIRPELSSIPGDWSKDASIHLLPEDIPLFNEILQKIPRPYNFGFMYVLLDNVHWEDQLPQPCYSSAEPPNFRYCNYFNNKIVLMKEFDYGNKCNPVTLMTKRTEENGTLTDRPAKLQQLLEQLGKPQQTELKCVFEEEEQARFSTDMQAFKQTIDRSVFEKHMLSYRPPAPNPSDFHDTAKIQDLVAETLTPAKGFSPKKVMTAVASKYGYRYQGGTNGEYRFVRFTPEFHRFMVTISIAPFQSIIDADIEASGYNYSNCFFTTRTLSSSETGLQNFAEQIFLCAQLAEEHYYESLRKLFGPTPAWFWKNQTE